MFQQDPSSSRKQKQEPLFSCVPGGLASKHLPSVIAPPINVESLIRMPNYNEDN